MILDLSKFSPNQIDLTMMQTLIPRPIAWVLTQNSDTTYHLSFFSYFNAIASDPPLIFISVGKKDKNTKNNTWTNIEERDEFIVHIPDVDFVREVNQTSETLNSEVSQINKLSLELMFLEPKITSLPIVKKIKIAFICQKYQIIEIGNISQGLIFGKVKFIYVEDSCIAGKKHKNLNIDPLKINPLSRLGADTFATLGNLIYI